MDTQEISAHVTIETTPSAQLGLSEVPPRGLYLSASDENEAITSDLLLGRWRLSLDLFSRVFMEDVGIETGSIISELGGFSVKEACFRRNMEKLRNGQQKDLVLTKLERNRSSLLFQTFKELNTQFGSQNRRSHPPLTINRVKVTFNNEPGEGSGVARSFYTSIAEAILANEKLPNLEGAQVGKYVVPFSNMLRQRAGGSSSLPGNGGLREAASSSLSNRRVFSNKSLWRPNRDSRKANYDARLYNSLPVMGSAGSGGNSNSSGVPTSSSSALNSGSNASNLGSANPQSANNSGLVDQLPAEMNERLYPKLYTLPPHKATGNL